MMAWSTPHAMTYQQNEALMDAHEIHQFDGRGIAQKIRSVALIAALRSLSVGEAIRYQDVEDPFSLIRTLMIEFGSKIAWEYIDRRPNVIIIEFTRVEYSG